MQVEKATQRRRRPAWLVLTVLGATGTIVTLQNTIFVPLIAGFPALLDVSIADASWIITATQVTAAVTTPLVTKLADMRGKRLMILLCLAAIVLSSAIGVAASSLAALVVSRALAGVAQAVLPIGIAILRDELPPHRVPFGIAILATTLGLGTSLGLPLGGVIYEAFGWQSVFVVGGALALPMMLLIPLVVSESPTRSGGRFDWTGAVLLSLALMGLLLGISKGAEWGWTAPMTLGCFAVAAVGGTAWLLWELRTANPVVDLRLSVLRPILLTNLATLLLGFAMFANFLTTAQQAQVPVSAGGPGASAAVAGLVVLPCSVAGVLLGPVSGWLVSRYGGRPVVIAGAAVTVVGYLYRIPFANSLTEIIIGSIIPQLGVALLFGALPDIIMGHVPIGQTASANGLNALIRSIGTAVASAGVAAIFQLSLAQADGVVYSERSGYNTIYLLAALFSLAAMVMAILLPREGRREYPAAEAAEA